MNNPATLDPAVQHIRNATQALWDARNKGNCSQAESAFLEPIQLALQTTLEELEEARSFLQHRAE